MPTKTIKSSPGSDSGIVVSENITRITTKEENSVEVAEKGVTINGPVSFVSGPDQIRVGGLWTFNEATTMSLPSTLATPHPVLKINPPVRQIASLIKDAAVMMSLLAGV